MTPLCRIVDNDDVVYKVWDPVVRISHWVNFVTLFTLVYTGFAIGGTAARAAADEPVFNLHMATLHNIHYLAGYLFAANGVVRVYWLFAGKTYHQWFRNNFWTLDYWREIFWKMKEYGTLAYLDHPVHTLEHNAVATASYTVSLFAGFILALTGFGMLGQINPGGVLQHGFGWVIGLLGGEANVKALHRFSMWFLIALAIFHIGLVVLLDCLGERGMISSIFGGIKTMPKRWKPDPKPWLTKS